MSPDRLEECLSALHWTPDVLARALECDVSLVNAWMVGLAQAPPKAAAWIETLGNIHESAEGMKPKGLKGKRFDY